MASKGEVMNAVSRGNGGQTRSGQAILNWYNDLLRSNIQKVEDLCTGAAYCCLMDILVPNSIQLKNIRMMTFEESDYIYNLGILQRTLRKFQVNKNIPIHKLIKGEFQGNYEFAVWFRRFFDTNFSEMPDNYNVLKRRQYQPIIKGLAVVPSEVPLQTPKPIHQNMLDGKPCVVIKPQPVVYNGCSGSKPQMNVMNIPMFARQQRSTSNFDFHT